MVCQKCTRLMLRIGKDLFDAGHRVAEHLSFNDFFKNSALVTPLKKSPMGSSMRSISSWLTCAISKVFQSFCFRKSGAMPLLSIHSTSAWLVRRPASPP